MPVSKLYSSSSCQSLNKFSLVKNPLYTDLENFHASSPQQCLSLPVTNLLGQPYMSSCSPAEYCSQHLSNSPLLTCDETPTSQQQSSDQSNLESAADVSEPVFVQGALAQKCAFSQSSLTGISSQLSYTAQVAFASNPLKNAIQKVRLNCCICDFKTYRLI